MPNPEPDLSLTLVESLDGLRAARSKVASRPVHAKGLCATGTFTATRDAATYTRAAHMQGTAVPVTVRFSNASDDPNGPDTAPAPRGMAVKFHLAGGRVTDLVSMSTPFFPVGTVADFLEIVRVQTPERATGKPPVGGLEAFLRDHKQAAKWFELVIGTPLPGSFAGLAYYPIHAFRFVDAGGKPTVARYRWHPRADVPTLSKDAAARAGPDYLLDEFRARLQEGPVVFTLQLQLAGQGDDPTDPTVAWPADRRSVVVGTLEVTAPLPDGPHACEALSFDPTRLVDGIEPSSDPILAARGGAYRFSAKRRSV